MSETTRRFAVWMCLGCSIHFFGACYPYFYFLTNPANRQIYHWDRLDLISALLAVVILGAAAAAAAYALRRALKRRHEAAFHRLFHLYVFLAVGSLLLDAPIPVSGLFWVSAGTLIMLALVCLSLRWPKVFSKGLILIFLIFSPTIVIYFAGAVRYRTIPASIGREPLRAAKHRAGHVIVVLFDMWSYDEAFARGEPLEWFPHLARMSSESIVLHSAVSPRLITLESIPRLLTMNPLGIIAHEYMANDRDASEVFSPSIFSLARDKGFKTFAIGSHLPYTRWYGRDLDRAAVYSYYKHSGTGLFRRLAHTLWLISRDNLALRLSGISAFVNARIVDSITSYNLEGIHSRTLGLLAADMESSLIFAHYNIPHAAVPLPRLGQSGAGTPVAAEYRRLLAAADEKLGELIEALRKSGRWDDSLVILTSDHGIRYQAYPPCHVPTLIKLPGQRRRTDSHVSFDLRRLRGIIKTALERGLSSEAFGEDRDIRRLLSGGKQEIASCGPLPYPEI